MYPKNKAKFDAWHKAMVAGATVDKPDYGKSGKTEGSKKSRSRSYRGTNSRRRRKRKAKKNA